jgi:hypothetical protein
MSPQTYGLILLTILAAASLALCGAICTRKGREAGRLQGQREGFNGGWARAHRRIALALNVPAESLHLAILELEISANPSDPETTIANLLRTHRARESKTAAESAEQHPKHAND